MFNIIWEIIPLILIGAPIILLIRNALVFKFRLRLLNLIRAEIGMINNKNYEYLHNMYINGPSYDRMLFTLHKCTFNQFYPHAYDHLRYK
jgi:hypothetical protein